MRTLTPTPQRTTTIVNENAKYPGELRSVTVTGDRHFMTIFGEDDGGLTANDYPITRQGYNQILLDAERGELQRTYNDFVDWQRGW